MCKKLFVVGFLMAITAFVGCGDKFTCENMSKKNEKCMDEIMEVMLEGSDKMPEEMKKKMTDGFKKNMTGEKFIKMCKKNLDQDGKKEETEKIKKCFKKSDCKEYAKCLKESL